MIYDSNIVGEVLARYRTDKGLSQEVLSGLADIGRTHLSMLETGARKPTLDTFFKLASALNVPASEMTAEIERQLALNGRPTRD